MNDGNRLGFHLYVYLKGELPSVAEAIYEGLVDFYADRGEHRRSGLTTAAK